MNPALTLGPERGGARLDLHPDTSLPCRRERLNDGMEVAVWRLRADTAARDREDLALAIRESRRCVPCDTCYRVGAVIRTTAGELFTGYTHETSPTHHAEQEGVNLCLLTNPKRVLADENGRVRAIVCSKMELGEPDASGRRSPVEIPGSEFEIECDAVVIAIGNRPNPLIPMTTSGLKTTKKGTLEVDPDTLQTSMEGVFAGGDVVSGAATVISAMGQAKKAAASINKFLKGEPLKEPPASESACA